MLLLWPWSDAAPSLASTTQSSCWQTSGILIILLTHPRIEYIFATTYAVCLDITEIIMHYKSSSNLTKLYTVVINCSAGHCFNILDNNSTPSSLEKHFSQSQPKSFHRLLSLEGDSEQLGPTRTASRTQGTTTIAACDAGTWQQPPSHNIHNSRLTSTTMPWCSTSNAIHANSNGQPGNTQKLFLRNVFPTSLGMIYRDDV